MKKSRNIHFHIQGGYNQILPNAESGTQNVYGIQTIASYKKNHRCHIALAVVTTMLAFSCCYCCLAHNALEEKDLQVEHLLVIFQKYQETHP